MRRPRSTNEVMLPFGRRKWRPIHMILMVAGLYLVFVYIKFPHFLQIAYMLGGDDDVFFGLNRHISGGSGLARPLLEHDAFHRKLEDNLYLPGLEERGGLGDEEPVHRPLKRRFGTINGEIIRWRWNRTEGELSQIDKLANEAWVLGTKAWEEVEGYDVEFGENVTVSIGSEGGKQESCPSMVMMSKEEMKVVGNGGEQLMFLPCGLAAGSSITVVGTPHQGHVEYVPQLARLMPGTSPMVTVSQFMVELQGLKAVDGEDPPRIFHLNPRLKGDWSRRPVIEHNTCYRMQWGSAQRCDGLQSKDEDDKVDGFGKCEKWVRDDVVDSKESKTTPWLNRFIGRAKKPAMTWPFPFVEGKLFVLTIRAGLEGFHINVGGRHTTSFPYRPGFSLEDATGLVIKGNVDVYSVYATSLPVSHPSFSLQRVLDMSGKWKSRPLPKSPITVFIGILSATNHFAERMAIRKTWMQTDAIKSSKAVARFFVALNPRKDVNLLLKREADYFGDIVILPFMDRYELVVLKTIAICEFGVQNMTTAYIMKCDDDTFVRVDTILKEIYSISSNRSLYMGNLNLFHRPLRTGKWAVTFQEWPEEIYPPYANGPGYIISIDIARFIASQHVNQRLKLFKMEDVSMGMWVEQFNTSTSVQYSHNWKFCQYGCMEDYYTAHYQSPRQMICLWDKLARGRPQCCNFR